MPIAYDHKSDTYYKFDGTMWNPLNGRDESRQALARILAPYSPHNSPLADGGHGLARR